MHTSYVHCRLLPGGAANVLTTLIREHGHDEQTKIYTLFSDQKTRDVDGHTIPVVGVLPRGLQSVFLFFQQHYVPGLSWLFDYRNLMFFYPQLIAILRYKIRHAAPDHLVISSFAVAKNIVQGDGGSEDSGNKRNNERDHYATTLYLHSPMQYIHTHATEYQSKVTGIKGALFRWISKRLHSRDTQPRSYDTIVANSQYTADCANNTYHLTADHIQYPPINEQFGRQAPILKPDNYFVYVGRLVKFVKEVDVLIKLANQTGMNLVLIGSGPDEAYLKSIAGPTCLFVGRISDPAEKIDIIRKSRGLINITKESFGIATAEALLCGIPVLGYNDGASPELVDEHSGILVDDKSLKTLLTAYDVFSHREWDRNYIWERAKQLLR